MVGIATSIRRSPKCTKRYAILREQERIACHVSRTVHEGRQVWAYEYVVDEFPYALVTVSATLLAQCLAPLWHYGADTLVYGAEYGVVARGIEIAHYDDIPASHRVYGFT